MKLHDLYMILNEAQLLETLELLRIRKGDSTSIEVKSAHGDVPQNLGSTLCAFANMPERVTIWFGKTIQIRLLPDRLVIQSPGGLRGVSIDQLYSEAHAQATVNKTLYELAKRLSTKDGASVIEGEGGGIREVLRACGELGLAKPVFSDKGTEFTAILFRPVQAPSVPALSFSGSKAAALVLNKNAQLVLSRLADHGRATINDLSFSLGLSKPQVRYALKQLQAANLVSLIGKQGSRNSYYEMVDTQSESS